MSDADDRDGDVAADAPHPRQTTSLFGHKDAEAAILESYRGGRVPHAWLIGGITGIGKATLAYRFARRHADDARFSFGTGKLGELAGFASAIILALIAVLIGYESIVAFCSRLPSEALAGRFSDRPAIMERMMRSTAAMLVFSAGSPPLNPPCGRKML